MKEINVATATPTEIEEWLIEAAKVVEAASRRFNVNLDIMGWPEAGKGQLEASWYEGKDHVVSMKDVWKDAPVAPKTYSFRAIEGKDAKDWPVRHFDTVFDRWEGETA